MDEEGLTARHALSAARLICYFCLANTLAMENLDLSWEVPRYLSWLTNIRPAMTGAHKYRAGLWASSEKV